MLDTMKLIPEYDDYFVTKTGKVNPSNDNIDNLRWDTPKNNVADMKIHGTMLYGEANSNAKLTYSQVECIKKYPIYRGSHTYLAKLFNVSRPQISNIIHGRQWQSNGKSQ